MQKGKLNNGVSVPQEIICDILKELPVKTLLRLRCVSKLWRSIIDNDPLFAQSHHNRSFDRPNGVNLLFLTSGDYQWQQWRLYYANPKGGPALHLLNVPISQKENYPLYSVKGLVCFQNCVCNPSTRECKVVRGPDISIPGPVPLGEHPLTYRSFNLLGFDPFFANHKLLNITEIRFTQNNAQPRTQFKVLTLRRRGASTAWREIPRQQHQLRHRYLAEKFLTARPFPDPDPNKRWSLYHKTVCCTNDTIFCLGMISSVHAILAFKVGPESLKIVQLPKDARSDSCFAIEVRKRLALINSEVTKIWILEDYDQDKPVWSHYTPNFPLLLGGTPTPIGEFSGEILFQYHTSNFFSYNLERGAVTSVPNLAKLQENVPPPSPPFVMKHVESLF